MKKILIKLKSLSHRFSLFLKKKITQNQLKAIDKRIASAQPQDIPELFTYVTLDVFGKLLLDIPSIYPNTRKFFPSMAADDAQDLWTGGHGMMLLGQSLAFMKTLSSGYKEIIGRPLKDAKVLDFGCGWGRLVRLLYKFVSYEQIYGIDPWEKSIEICKIHGVRGNLAISEYVPHRLPYEIRFDLIFAFSVFTHLSEKTCAITLSTLRNYISDDGLLIITIRPKEYWLIHENGVFASRMLTVHNESGFAFTPHDLPPIDGDITYGDTSISIAYFEKSFPQWTIVRITTNMEDPYQTILFLRPS